MIDFDQPISNTLKKYLNLREQLYNVRMKNDNYWSEDEEPIIEQMDDIWSYLTKEEHKQIKDQGCWKFK